MHIVYLFAKTSSHISLQPRSAVAMNLLLQMLCSLMNLHLGVMQKLHRLLLGAILSTSLSTRAATGCDFSHTLE